MARRKSETGLVTELLLQDWDSPEDLADSIIKAVDEDRAKRTSYVAIMQFGEGNGSVFYMGLGPYAGAKSARKAVKGFPGATEAYRIAVVPVTSQEGLRQQLEELNTPPPPVKENAADKKNTNRRFYELMNGERTHIKMDEIKILKVEK